MLTDALLRPQLQNLEWTSHSPQLVTELLPCAMYAQFPVPGNSHNLLNVYWKQIKLCIYTHLSMITSLHLKHAV